MTKDTRAKPGSQQKTALRRIHELFSEAASGGNSKLSDRYVALARKISMKMKVPFTKQQKMQFCPKCFSYLKPGQNARVRMNRPNIVIRCIKCGNTRRMRYK